MDTVHRYFPRSKTRSHLLAELERVGFTFTNDEGETFIPEPFTFTSSQTRAECIYLGKPVTGGRWDEEGNEIEPPVISGHYCANVVSQQPIEFLEKFKAEQEPNNPYNVFK